MNNGDLLTNSNLDAEDTAKIRNEIMTLISKYAESAHAEKPFIPGKSLIPVSGKVFGEAEIQMLVSSSLDFWLTTGRFNTEFDKRLSEFLGIKHIFFRNASFRIVFSSYFHF